MIYNLYWIHQKDHTDMFTQGYIGIAMDANKRWNTHYKRQENTHLSNAIKKYGWDNLIKEVVLIADKSYCLIMELKLRYDIGIGWNIAKGGGMPPSSKGNKYRLGLSAWNKGKSWSDEMKEKLRIAHIGQIPPNKGKKGLQVAWNKGTKGMMGIPWNKGVPIKEENKAHYRVLVTCPKCGAEGKIAGMRRWHFDNCKGQRNFEARVTVNNKRFSIGTYATKEEAKNASKEYYKGLKNG
jgi:hypothetical protein